MGCCRRRVEITGGDNVVGSSSGSIDFQDLPPKRKKNHHKDESEQNSDRLILSYLPMKDAVGTGILCKRWKTLWTLVDRIRFCCDANDFEPIYFRENDNVNGVEYLSMQKGNFQHLKNVRIVDGRNLCVKKKSRRRDLKSFEFEFVAYLLKNTCFLEKFVFTSPVNNNCKCSINCGLQLSPILIKGCLDGNEAGKCEFKKKQSEYEFIYLRRGLKSRQVNSL